MANPSPMCLLAVDLGAGSGAKLGLFTRRLRLLAEGFLPIDRYGASASSLADALSTSLVDLLRRNQLSCNAVQGVGLAAPGLFRSDGTILTASNLPFLAGIHLGRLLNERLGLPTHCINDADAGALAEWTRRRRALLYWVLGGGWGGAWVSVDGRILYPSLDWNGDDRCLHYTNEPGYAIPVEKSFLDERFRSVGRTFQGFEQFALRHLGMRAEQLIGPCGRRDAVRAELFVSGPGRWRIFRYLTGDWTHTVRRLGRTASEALASASTAGSILDQLARAGVSPMRETDRIFGEIVAEASRILFAQARPQGCSGSIPIYLAGKPSHALPFFGPFAVCGLRSAGIRSLLRLSLFERRGRNANLHGAAYIARERARRDIRLQDKSV